MVERVIGNDEAESSILSRGTIFLHFPVQPQATLVECLLEKRKERIHAH